MSSAESTDYDVIVIGGGHAGCEAFAAASRIGVRAALVTPRADQVGFQPCNPAVGGPGKGHLVREVVALGGLMGLVTDRAGIQFRTLNRRKGPAVRSTRVQTDSAEYIAQMQQELLQIAPPCEIVEDFAVQLLWSKTGSRRKVSGVALLRGGTLSCNRVVVTTGTYLRGMLHVGDQSEPGGRRDGGAPSIALAESLAATGLPMLRLKTGTCPRLDGSTLDTSRLEEQPGEKPEPFFDPSTADTLLPQQMCHLTYTGERAHEILRANMETSAMYSGTITGIGPRYCPSIETKIARFPHRERHQIFLEPEDSLRRTIYPSGLSTSLPEAVQQELVRSIPGLERARILRYGYAVEYDAIQPTCLKPSLEVDGFDGLYLAGQILGTSGYEEAAALGLVAGANAALDTRGDNPLALSRDQSYAGVMIDDLTGRGVDEPYRMFTSRAEYRLLLREDNADERLLEEGTRAGLVKEDAARRVRDKVDSVQVTAERLSQSVLTPSSATNARLSDLDIAGIKKPTALLDLLRRDGVTIKEIVSFAPWLESVERAVRSRVETDIKYEGYLDRQEARARKLDDLERVIIPADIPYDQLPGLRGEIVEKLEGIRPSTLGQASRIPGVTPASIEILHVYCEKVSRTGD